MWRQSRFRGIKECLTGVITFSIFLQTVGYGLVYLLLLVPLEASAAEVAIDTTVSTAANSANLSGSRTVFINDTTGYVFYRDRDGRCVYSKTSDQGDTWSAATIYDNQTDCVKVSVWYDRWTPGDDTGTFIHLGSMDTSLDDLFYNRLDTSDDSLLTTTGTNAAINSGQTPTIGNGANTFSITKATDGEVYMTVSDGGDSYVVSCASSCDNTANWNEVGTSPLDNSNDHSLLLPLSGGDVMLLNRDVSANDIRSAIWNGTTWSSWNTVDGNAVENATYDGGLAAAVNKNSGDIYIAYAADHNNYTAADHDIRTAIYDGSGWSNQTDVFTNIAGRGLHDVTIAIDENTDDVYVAYAIQDTINTNTTANVYYRVSTDSMSSWGSEQGPVSSTAGNIYGPSLNLFDNERLYVTWFNQTDQTLYGETVADIGPDTLVSSLGSNVTEARAGDNDVYLGGTYVIESISSRTISALTFTEVGTAHGQNDIDDIKIFYELDTTLPYDCVSESYGGSESQFGATDATGFSGANGTASFAGTIVGISPTETMCVYVVLSVAEGAPDASTIDVEISDPPSDVTVSGTSAFPTIGVNTTGSTTVVSSALTQTHFHWRNDDGSESGATSATAGLEDTPLAALSKNVPQRIRLQVSNEGSTSTLSSNYQLEFAAAAPTCADATDWAAVPASGSIWEMFDSGNLTDGDNTTNIATLVGGVTDENVTFLTPNTAVRDATSTVPNIILETDEFIEFEFSVQAVASAVEGETYCFRVTANGEELFAYDQYPSATIAADVAVSASGSQVTELDIPSVDAYIGGAFVIEENSTGRTLTSITLTEQGTVDAENDLSNVELYYDIDTTLPYDCVSETYNPGVDPQYGSAGSFSGENGSSTISGTLVLAANSAACFYVVLDVEDSAQDSETIDVVINSPSTDVVVNTGSVGPSTPADITGSSSLRGAVLTQTHYHWRNDNGSETTATSYTGGSEDTPVADFSQDTPIRLRLGISNEGATTSVDTVYRLQYGAKITTCSAISVWTDVHETAEDEWDMFESANLTDGADTTNIAVSSGGVSDENATFQTNNNGVAESNSTTGTSTLTATQHLDLEFSITSTINTSFETDFCFRVVGNDVPLLAYDQYAEITTLPKRDFRVQRGTAVITGTATTVSAGVDYTAPAATSSAFVRITNTHHTGAGRIAGGGSQRADEVTAYISDQTDITSSITFTRADPTATNDTYINWEIVEFVGEAGTDNEIVVRSVGTANFSNGDLSITEPAVSGVLDDDDVVVFVTGAGNRNTARNFYASQVTSEWSSSTDEAIFTRGATGNALADISYAVVEFVGANWSIQRVEHTYAAAGVTETESISPVNSPERAFLHTQKRMGATTNVVHYGHTVWLSSLGVVSFELESGANVAVGQTSVAWVIENTQQGLGAMEVQRVSGSTTGGAEPLELSISIPVDVLAMNNTSLFGNSRAGGTNNAHPRAIHGLLLTAVDSFQVWRSDSGQLLTYRTEIVEWPVADLALRQNYYRFYVDNNELTPTDPWPAGPTDLGENVAVTATDQALGEGELTRLRMSVRVSNANLSPGIQAFKLQYGLQATTCSAVENWFDVGNVASSTVWRGFAATGTTDGTALSTDPPQGGDLLLSVSDVAGRLVHENPSVANPYTATDGEDVEYDWYIEQNGATPSAVYCFRMSRLDAPLDGYFNYPSLRTAGFSPVTASWRWYSDSENETPSSDLAAVNTAPTDIANEDVVTLRVTVDETKNVISTGAKFRVQVSEYPDFSFTTDVLASTTCTPGALWCYAEAPVADNTLITTALLGDNDGCTGGTGDGCGTHNSQPAFVTGHTHGAGNAQEYSFTLQSAAPRVNATYYFRLIDTVTGQPVPLADGASYPSLVTESPTLAITIAGVGGGVSTAGVVTNTTTTPAAIPFGSLGIGAEKIAAHRLTIDGNATEGFQIFKYARSQMISSNGNTIAPLAASNTSPGSWTGLCDPLSVSCFGYHSTDATLADNSTRFAAFDTYAGLHTELEEVIFSSIPTTTTEDIVYRIVATELQPAGQYETDIIYIAVPVY